MEDSGNEVIWESDSIWIDAAQFSIISAHYESMLIENSESNGRWKSKGGESNSKIYVSYFPGMSKYQSFNAGAIWNVPKEINNYIMMCGCGMLHTMRNEVLGEDSVWDGYEVVPSLSNGFLKQQYLQLIFCFFSQVKLCQVLIDTFSHPSAMPSAPPPLWQSDALRGNEAKSNENSLFNRNVTCDQTSEAYRHVKSVVSDARRDFDLHDLLLSTRREETYQPYPAGVSFSMNFSQLHRINKIMYDLIRM
jgi:hypothetical protein